MGRGSRSTLKLTLDVYFELRNSVGEEVSTADLMLAAQELVRISKGEYIERVVQERSAKQNYFSQDLDWAFKNKQSQILCFETTTSEEAMMTDMEKERLYALQTRTKESPWEF